MIFLDLFLELTNLHTELVKNKNERMWDFRSDKPATVAAVQGPSPARHGGHDRRAHSPRRRANTPGPDGVEESKSKAEA